MALGKAAKKSSPVPVGDPLEDMALWVTFKNVVRKTEKEIESLKPRIQSFVPHIHGSSEAFPSTRVNEKTGDTEEGEYVVDWTVQDCRNVDNDLLHSLVNAKVGEIHAVKYMRMVIDPELVAPLIADGTITKKEFEACMTGPIKKYAKCEWKAKK
jgi:hypothetical protein